jgi:hypothetical protein
MDTLTMASLAGQGATPLPLAEIPAHFMPPPPPPTHLSSARDPAIRDPTLTVVAHADGVGLIRTVVLHFTWSAQR